VAEAPALEGGPATLAPGGGLTVHLTDKRHYGMTLLLATGSAQHIDELRALAARLDSGAKCNRAMQTGFARLCQAL
jgi:DNA polymerase (family X)